MRSVTLGQIALAAPAAAASENPRSSGNRVGSLLPTPENQHPRSLPSGACARKTPPHSSHRPKSSSSSADDTEADRAPLPRTPTRSHSDPVGPPRRRQNTPSDLPATSRPGSAVKANLAQEDRIGRSSPYWENCHIHPVTFNPHQWFTVEYSDTLLGAERKSQRGFRRIIGL